MVLQTWKIASHNTSKKNKDWLLDVLAKNRGLNTKKQLDDFLNPTLEQIIETKPSELKIAAARVKAALKNKEKIIVYSDYDADGLCASAIVWETLFDLGASIMPYVPHRIKEGYGLSTAAIGELAKKGVKLIITVDHGITAVRQVEEAKKLGIDVIITDHHLKPKSLPKSFAIVHTTQLCGAGVAWRFCYELVSKIKPDYRQNLIQKLELAAIATIADLVPLTGANRAIVKIGLEKISKTARPGIKSLIAASRLNGAIGTFEIGHIIAPRINAMGRIGHGLDSLRLLCAKSEKKANSLASLLGKTNSKRQDLTTSAITSALGMVDKQQLVGVLSHDAWHEGVIGLVASRLVEAHFRPMVIISRGAEFSKGSARSIPGFNIVDAIRASSEYLVDAGGHPMAAGFTIKTEHIEAFSKSINVYAQKTITQAILSPTIRIECELSTSDINSNTLKIIKTLEPYGIANPYPIFLTKKMMVEDVRGVGQNSQHLKLQLGRVGAIGFNMGAKRADIRPGDYLDIVYTLEEDKFNGNGQVQLKIKDFKPTDS